MKEQGFVDETAHFIFSRKVGAEEFSAHADAVALCPSLFQEYIEKDHELRITIVGDETFCCRIDSQSVDGAKTDWRQVDPSKVPHRIVPLDPGIEDKLRQMLQRYGLRYGAFDMIVTPQGEYVFLELNPNGQWLWIELMTGAPITNALVQELTH
jgi:glutathione synthase/RimK-type ligase-like ATP-grasp enzyme